MSFRFEELPLLPDSEEVLKAKERAREIALERHPIWITGEDLLLALAETGTGNELIDSENPQTLALRIRENLRFPVDRPELRELGVKPQTSSSYWGINMLASLEARRAEHQAVLPIDYWKATLLSRDEVINGLFKSMGIKRN